ncbi:MAG TPA: rod shape-determining protein MreC [Acidimicrobiales bacterium]|nr:rod shape-determining protein MreC [Acidimicrobiales bacterium]
MALNPPTGSRTRVAILAVASVTLLTAGLRDSTVVREVREGVATVVRPVESAVDTATQPVRNAWQGVSGYDDLERENEELRAQLEAAEAEGVRSSDAENQLADLSAALDLPFAGNVETVAVRVVSGPRSNFSHAVEIDKGTNDGVAVGMPVVSGSGLVGRVSRASGGSSTVELLTDPDLRVGVRLATTGDLGTARGQGRGHPLSVDSTIRPGTDVADGTGVVTSGIDGSAYPPGIPVGTVASTHEGPGGLSLELDVEPLADIDALSYVSVMLWTEDAGGG